MRFLVLYFLMSILPARAQSSWPAVSWENAQNLTTILSSSGITELSGLHFNSQSNRLYCVQGNGRLRVLQHSPDGSFTQVANKVLTGGHEGITQADLSANTFYTIDEDSYEIRKYNHTSSFSTITLSRKWNLLAAPSPMQHTGNVGPEGIAFIPDSFLANAGFVSQQTGQLYTSTKGMGGLIFIAHQDGGKIWVYDINPMVSDDFIYVGNYLTNRTESCDLAFDRSTSMLYILHNITGSNTVETTSLASVQTGPDRKFVTSSEYWVSSPTFYDNIEAIALSPKCQNSETSKLWLGRDAESIAPFSVQQDVLRYFSVFVGDGDCSALSVADHSRYDLKIAPNPVRDVLSFGSVDGGTVRIFDYLGRMILNHRIDSAGESIDVANLAPGVYVAEHDSGLRRVALQFIKQ